VPQAIASIVLRPNGTIEVYEVHSA